MKILISNSYEAANLGSHSVRAQEPTALVEMEVFSAREVLTLVGRLFPGLDWELESESYGRLVVREKSTREELIFDEIRELDPNAKVELESLTLGYRMAVSKEVSFLSNIEKDLFFRRRKK